MDKDKFTISWDVGNRKIKLNFENFKEQLEWKELMQRTFAQKGAMNG